LNGIFSMQGFHAATRQRLTRVARLDAVLLLKRKRGVRATGMVTSAPIP
jgi:hypothetical protein